MSKAGEHINKLTKKYKLSDIETLATWIGLSNGMIIGGEEHSKNPPLKPSIKLEKYYLNYVK